MITRKSKKNTTATILKKIKKIQVNHQESKEEII